MTPISCFSSKEQGGPPESLGGGDLHQSEYRGTSMRTPYRQKNTVGQSSEHKDPGQVGIFGPYSYHILGVPCLKPSIRFSKNTNGCFPQLGSLFRSPCNKGHSMLGSMLGPAIYGNPKSPDRNLEARLNELSRNGSRLERYPLLYHPNPKIRLTKP